MKTIRKMLALTLVLCMVMALGVWNTAASADWYTVKFTKVENKNFEDVPTGISADKASGTTSGTTTAAGTDLSKPGQLEWFYNPWAGTLVIQGRGAMVGFDEKHPAPWNSVKKTCLRVIIDEGVTTVSNEAFKDFERLQSVVFPSTLKAIAASAFEKCEKLKRVEVVTEIEEAEKLIKASKSEELLKDDVKIVRVTREAIRKEILWLTTYWLDRVKIYRDRAGRPVRIIEHKCDGSVIDTGIKYLNPATAVNQAKDPDTAERVYSVTTTKAGDKSAKEREVTEKGQTLIKGEYELNKNGRQVRGTEFDYESSPAKRTLNSATYYADGSGTKNWTSVGIYGGTTQIVEQVDKNDKILSVKSTTYDKNGVLSEKSETKNSYNSDGNKTSTTVTRTDQDGNVTAKENTSYSYNSSKQLTEKTVSTTNEYGTRETTSNYSYDSAGNLKTEKESSDDGFSTLTEYNYTDKGKKTSKTVTATMSNGAVSTTETRFDDNERASEEKSVNRDASGKTVSTEVTEYSYNSDHILTKSVSTTTDEAGTRTTKVTEYDADGRVTKGSWEAVGSDGKKSTGWYTQAFDGNGNVTAYHDETTEKDGTVTKYFYEASYDATGRVVSEKSNNPYAEETTDKSYTYDASGRVTKEESITTAPDGTKTGSTTIYTYNPDGSYTKKVIPIVSEETTTVTVTTVDKDGTESEAKQETVETAVVQEEIKAVTGSVQAAAAIAEDNEKDEKDEEKTEDEDAKLPEDADQETREGEDGKNNVNNEEDAENETKSETEGEPETGTGEEPKAETRAATEDESKEDAGEEKTAEEPKDETSVESKTETEGAAEVGTEEESKAETKAATEEESAAEMKEEPAAETKEESSGGTGEEPATEMKEEPVAETKEESAAETGEESAAETKEEPATETKGEPAVENKDEPAAENKDEPTAETKDEPVAETKAEADAQPQAEVQQSAETQTQQTAEVQAPPAHVHNCSVASATIREARCNVTGIVRYVCPNCPDHVYADRETGVNPAAHTFGAPYEKEPGVWVVSCALCGAIVPAA